MRTAASNSLRGLVVVALACGLQHACGHDQANAVRPDVLLVSIDSLRADHLGCYGYNRDTTPNIDRIAAEGVRFDSVVSTTSWTLPAHAALFTGLYDPAHGTTDVYYRLAPSYHTVAEHFHDAGWATVGLYAGPLLHPTFGLDQGFDSWVSCMSEPASEVRDDQPASLYEANLASHADITGPRTVETARTVLEQPTDKPLFLFVHLWDPHYDYIPPAPYDRLFDPDYRGTLDVRNYALNATINPDMSRRDLEHVIALYDGEIRFSDDNLGELIRILDEARPGRQRVTIVTADHGDEFFEHGRKGHQQTLFEESIRVPLIVHWPERLPAGVVIGGQASLVDVAPTIVSLAGLDPMPVSQGIDLTDELDRRQMPERGLLSVLAVGGTRIEAIRTSRSKLLRSQGLLAHLDLDTDPHEHELLPGPPDDSGFSEHTLDEILEQSEALREQYGDGQGARRLDPQMEQRLRALGYVR